MGGTPRAIDRERQNGLISCKSRCGNHDLSPDRRGQRNRSHELGAPEDVYLDGDISYVRVIGAQPHRDSFAERREGNTGATPRPSKTAAFDVCFPGVEPEAVRRQAVFPLELRHADAEQSVSARVGPHRWTKVTGVSISIQTNASDSARHGLSSCQVANQPELDSEASDSLFDRAAETLAQLSGPRSAGRYT